MKRASARCERALRASGPEQRSCRAPQGDRKSTGLNSSHMSISYAVFCLKKKKKNKHGLVESKAQILVAPTTLECSATLRHEALTSHDRLIVALSHYGILTCVHIRHSNN